VIDLDLDEQLGFNLVRVANLFKREHARALREHKLTPEQWQALATLWRHGTLKQAEIARVTMQDAPAVSRMLVRMERNGWLERLADPQDARSSLVRLTAEGRQLRHVLPAKLIRHFRTFLRNFPDADQKQLVSLLRQLREATGDLEPRAPQAKIRGNSLIK
jgi:MarR family transcriptional regulator, lower aerobic nicotinate degradation pathway regulator